MTLVVVDGVLESVTGEVATPFGVIPYWQYANYPMIQLPYAPVTPPAIAYAAKCLGAERVLLVLRDVGVSEMVAVGDFVEFTHGRFTTFFSHIGTGYIQQVPPFCPELREAALRAGAGDGGTLLVVDELSPPQSPPMGGRQEAQDFVGPAQSPPLMGRQGVRQWWAAHGIELISTRSQPEGTLCRELEMCVAVVVVPPALDLQEWVRAVDRYLPSERSCDCDQTMVFARQNGRLAADWREWIVKEKNGE